MTDIEPRVDQPSELPHLLYVAWGYPPSRGAGMYRALATANAFARNGWRVTVLTATKDTYERLTGSDPAAEASIDPSISVVRVPFDPARGEGDLSKWSRSRLFSPLLWNFLRWVRARTIFPETVYASWMPILVNAADAIHSEQPTSLVIGSANPNVDFMPGDHLHRTHGVPYVMDHRDAWHLDVYTGKRTASTKSRSGKLEKRLISNAAEAWFVNAPIRDWHAAEYPERAEHYHVVANGFDPDFLDTTRDRLPNSHEGVVFGYLGTIYGPIPLRKTLEGWRLARSRSELLARSRIVFRGRLGHFAEPDAAAAELLDEFADDGVSYGGPVSKTEVAEVYRGFDAVLLIISRSKFVTSGKVFEYAATGLPIVALHHPETAATSILEGHPARYAVPNLSAESIAAAFIAAGEKAASMTLDDYAEARTWAAHLARDEQLLPRIAALRALVTGGAQ